jgi:lipopolysaccharide transport system permease protein
MKKIHSFLRTFFKYRGLFSQLVTRDIKLKYRRSILGYFWSILNPLLVMIVMTIVFSQIFRPDIKYFSAYLLIGHMLFNFMNTATSRSLASVINNRNLLRKIYIPKYIFTFAVVTSELVTFFFMSCALFIVIFATGIPFTWYIFLTLIPIIELYIFCIGLGLFLAQAAVFFRDFEYIWNVITTAWLYLSAIFYPITILPDNIRYLVTHYNPMYFYITLFRNFSIGDPNMGSLDFVVRGAVAAVIALLVGSITFYYNKKKFILYL